MIQIARNQRYRQDITTTTCEIEGPVGHAGFVVLFKSSIFNEGQDVANSAAILLSLGEASVVDGVQKREEGVIVVKGGVCLEE